MDINRLLDMFYVISFKYYITGKKLNDKMKRRHSKSLNYSSNPLNLVQNQLMTNLPNKIKYITFNFTHYCLVGKILLKIKNTNEKRQ